MRLPHWAGLDGLRGLAVAAVLLFHGGLSWAKGGFLGVSLFFTLSGFLITSIVLHEHHVSGRVSLTHFWARRARRLLPASILALGLAMVVTVVVIPSAQRIDALGDIRAAALNFANWRFIWRGDVYADVTRIASPVQHYWSLAIEEQFYLVFPVLALVALRWRRGALGVLFVVVIAWSVRQQLVIDNPARVYFGTDARAAELAIGGLLALGRERISGLLVGSARHAADIIGVVGLLATVVLWWGVSNTSAALHGGGFAVVGVVSAMVLLGAVEGHRLPGALSVGPLTALGLISYGVYLYHFPVYLAVDSSRVPLDGLPLLVTRVVITLVLAAASFWLVERPVRIGSRLRGHRSTAAFAGSLCVVLLSGVLVTRHYDGRIDSSELAGDVEVTLGAAPTRASPNGRAPHIVLVGDSTAATMGRGLEPWGSTTGQLRVTTVAGPGCATLPGERLRVRKGYEFSPKGCDALFTSAATVAHREDADAIVVLIGSSQLGDWTYPGDDGWRNITETDIQRAYRQAVDRALEQLEVAEVPILWADLPLPNWDLDAFGEFLGGPLPGSGPVALNDPARVAIVNRIDAAVVPEHPAAVLWSWNELLTGPDGRIPPDLRFDGLHVAAEHVPRLAESLLVALDQAYDTAVARGEGGLRTRGDHLWSRVSPTSG